MARTGAPRIARCEQKVWRRMWTPLQRQPGAGLSSLHPASQRVGGDELPVALIERARSAEVPDRLQRHCEACKLGAYRAAHRTSDRQRHVRTQLSVREALVQTRARYISLIGAVLRREGLRVASGSAASFVRRVAKLALPGQLKSEIAPLLAVFVSVDRQLVWIDTRLDISRGPTRRWSGCAPRPASVRHRRSLFLDRRRPSPLQERAPGGGLSGAHSERMELRGEAKQGAHHQGRQHPDAQTAGAGRGLDPAPAQPANRGAAEMGHRHRGPAREEDRHRGPGAEDGRSALCDDARPHLLLSAGIARTGGAGRLTRPYGASVVTGNRIQRSESLEDTKKRVSANQSPWPPSRTAPKRAPPPVEPHHAPASEPRHRERGQKGE